VVHDFPVHDEQDDEEAPRCAETKTVASLRQFCRPIVEEIPEERSWEKNGRAR